MCEGLHVWEGDEWRNFSLLEILGPNEVMHPVCHLHNRSVPARLVIGLFIVSFPIF